MWGGWGVREGRGGRSGGRERGRVRGGEGKEWEGGGEGRKGER